MRSKTAVSLATLALAAACSDSTGPGASTSVVGTYIADSIVCWTSFDTRGEITTVASVTFTLAPDSVLSGHLHIPAPYVPDNLPALDEDLQGSWFHTSDGARLFPPFGSTLSGIEFTIHGDTASADVVVKGWPLDPFGYHIRLIRQ